MEEEKEEEEEEEEQEKKEEDGGGGGGAGREGGRGRGSCGPSMAAMCYRAAAAEDRATLQQLHEQHKYQFALAIVEAGRDRDRHNAEAQAIARRISWQHCFRSRRDRSRAPSPQSGQGNEDLGVDDDEVWEEDENDEEEKRTLARMRTMPPELPMADGRGDYDEVQEVDGDDEYATPLHSVAPPPTPPSPSGVVTPMCPNPPQREDEQRPMGGESDDMWQVAEDGTEYPAARPKWSQLPPNFPAPPNRPPPYFMIRPHRPKAHFMIPPLPPPRPSSTRPPSSGWPPNSVRLLLAPPPPRSSGVCPPSSVRLPPPPPPPRPSSAWSPSSVRPPASPLPLPLPPPLNYGRKRRWALLDHHGGDYNALTLSRKARRNRCEAKHREQDCDPEWQRRPKPLGDPNWEVELGQRL